ncbi:hypothetical protein AOL_s00193g172 [Orbilia oligospora ATCC 24927]|uniref:Uncharacterized protein n=2 Tax=Orbilia oligospora TaxID=2813651 RepID=G1XRH3_ARTOA|nr:hypothetical protein AOL_s00193g172 [Orbilia oligospora ATCC 24927]EGX44260.1 hypothetical protein AOL_s00193g172 [Orbilia oligospora ATCC 24927]KAF3276653.1 hypothetical protein TWF970_006236 [Orbilia oligospora]
MAEIIDHLEVIYGVGRAPESIPEINGALTDLNSGHKGEFVYLKKVVKTLPPRPRRHHFEQQQQMQEQEQNADDRRRLQYIGVERLGHGDPARADLAKGAGGDFRLLRYEYKFAGPAIYDVALWRSGGRQCIPPAGWDGMSVDINEGRRGDYLYIVWKIDYFIC